MPELINLLGHNHKIQDRKRIVEYLVGGGIYFWSGYLFFFIAYSNFHWSLLPAKLSADIIGWTINFVLQRFWVFPNPRLANHKIEVTVRYILITLLDFALDYLIVWALKSVGISPYIGQFASAGFLTVWNYAWYRFWVFPERFPRKSLIKPINKA